MRACECVLKMEAILQYQINKDIKDGKYHFLLKFYSENFLFVVNVVVVVVFVCVCVCMCVCVCVCVS